MSLHSVGIPVTIGEDLRTVLEDEASVVKAPAAERDATSAEFVTMTGIPELS